ncbi:MAG: TPM domain-containing protein, partial [Burkholderiaceae bacterium]|nr:TPM domain-containing protein [Burkholderiaceae bacterium]
MSLRRLCTLLLALLLGAAAWAQDAVPALSGRVIDQTATLTAAQREALDARLAALEAERGAQVVILIVATTQPEDIAAYAQRVADSWKIGRREIGDGILIVVAKDDRKVRIEVAKALEGAVPDLAASRIIRDAITPAFKAGDFGGGLAAAVDRIAERIANEGLPEPDPAAGSSQRGSGFDWQDLAVFLFVGAPILGAILTGVLGRKLGALATGGVIGGIGWWITASLLVAGFAALVAAILVGVLGIGGRGGGPGGGGRGGGPIIWGGGGGGFSGG